MRLLIILLILVLSLPGFSIAENKNGYQPQKAQENIQSKENTRTVNKSMKVTFKENCVQKISNSVFLNMPVGINCSKEIKETIEDAFKRQPDRPVVWVCLTLNVKATFKLLQQKEPKIESFGKDDFGGLAGKDKVTPIVLKGIVTVDGYDRYLKQDLIYQLPLNATGLQVTIRNLPIVKMMF